jgi:predicted ATPase with chaperone activity
MTPVEWLEKLYQSRKMTCEIRPDEFAKAKKMEKKRQKKITNAEIKLASIERLRCRLEDTDLQIASADSLGFFIGAEWYRDQLKLKNKS